MTSSGASAAGGEGGRWGLGGRSDGHDGLELPRPRSGAAARPRGTEGLEGRRVLVTGASGFLGRRLVTMLTAVGAEVHAVSRRPSRDVVGCGHADCGLATWHRADLADAGAAHEVLRASDPCVVLHLASLVSGRRSPDLAVPMVTDVVASAVNLMAAAQIRGGTRVVLAGSIEETRVGDETPRSPYAAAKSAVTGYARMFHEQWGLPVTVLRPAMVYGPGEQDPQRLIPHVLDSLLAGRAPTVSSGRRKIDWVFIDDVCEAFVRAALSPAAVGLVADVGTGAAITIARMVELLAAQVGYAGELGLGTLPDRCSDGAIVADTAPAAASLAWSARTSLDEGLSRTVAWYRTHRRPELPTATRART